MADRRPVTKVRNATRRRLYRQRCDVSRLMCLFHGTIDALAAAQEGDMDAVHVVAALAGAQVGEGGREARHAVHLVQQLSDAASPVISSRTAPPRLPDTASRSTSAGAGWPPDWCSRPVQPWRCLHHNRRYALKWTNTHTSNARR